MGITVYNPQKGRLEMIDAVFTKENTTWFDDCEDNYGICSITDWQEGLIIKEDDYTYPLWIYDISREDIGYSCIRARKLYEQGAE